MSTHGAAVHQDRSRLSRMKISRFPHHAPREIYAHSAPCLSFCLSEAGLKCEEFQVLQDVIHVMGNKAYQGDDNTKMDGTCGRIMADEKFPVEGEHLTHFSHSCYAFQESVTF